MTTKDNETSETQRSCHRERSIFLSALTSSAMECKAIDVKNRPVRPKDLAWKPKKNCFWKNRHEWKLTLHVCRSIHFGLGQPWIPIVAWNKFCWVA